MRTTKLRYGALKSLPGMNHVRFEKEIELDEGDDEAAMRLELIADVHRQIDLNAEVVEFYEQRDALESHLEIIKRETVSSLETLAMLRKAVYAVPGWAEKVEAAGFEVPDVLKDDIPF